MITKQTQLKEILRIAEPCDRCGKCCMFGSGFLAGDDVKRIAKYLKITEEELKEKYLEEAEMFNRTMLRPKFEKPYGKCIFLEEQSCIVHPVKPVHCRIGNPCSGSAQELGEYFKLNFCVDPDDPESIRQWAICLSQNNTIPGGELHELVPDKKRLKRILSFKEL